jgi:hypothetical protein
MGRFDQASRQQHGTVIIDRSIQTFAVRPHRRRRMYELPLVFVAEWVCQHVIKIETMEKRAAKKKGRNK